MVKKLILIPDELDEQIKSFCKLNDIKYMQFIREALKAHYDSLKELRTNMVIDELIRILGRDVVVEKFFKH